MKHGECGKRRKLAAIQRELQQTNPSRCKTKGIYQKKGIGISSERKGIATKEVQLQQKKGK